MDVDAIENVVCEPIAPDRRVRYAAILRQLGWIALLVLVLGVLTEGGIAYRHWGWDLTAVARFRGDIHRNFTFGELALKTGYLNVHENQLRDNPPRDQKLDYPPLRLLTFEAWAAWNHATRPGEQWNESYDFHAPLMRYYTVLEWLAAGAALLIVWWWRYTCARSEAGLEPVSRWTGAGRGVAAFALLWFDPGVVIISHGWPSPNVWSLPFYLWPVLLCLWDLWFIAGLVLAIGTMLQGQLLSVVAVFVLWAIFAGRFMRLFRWASGFALGFMAVASPWMLSVRPDLQSPERLINWVAVAWIALFLAMLLAVGLARNLRGRVGWKLFLAPATTALVVGVTPVFRMLPMGTALPVLIGVAGWIVLFWVLPWSIKRYLLPLALAGCLLGCVPLFYASTAWWEVGFLYGAERFPHVASNLTSNLSTLFEQFLGWQRVEDLAFTIPAGWVGSWPTEPWDWTVRQFTGVLFGALLTINGFFIAWHWRRRSLNLLVALVLPWVLFFTVMPQMSPRYTVFAAGVGAICIGHSFGMTLLTWFFSFLTVIQTGLCMVWGSRGQVARDPNWLFNVKNQRIAEKLIPSLAWAEVLACLVFIAVAFNLVGGRRRPRTGRGMVPGLQVFKAMGNLMADSENSSRLDPGMADSAKQAAVPDVDVYDTPATPRESSANLWLSGVILGIGLIVAIWLLWAFLT